MLLGSTGLQARTKQNTIFYRLCFDTRLLRQTFTVGAKQTERIHTRQCMSRDNQFTSGFRGCTTPKSWSIPKAQDNYCTVYVLQFTSQRYRTVFTHINTSRFTRTNHNPSATSRRATGTKTEPTIGHRTGASIRRLR